MPLRLVIPRSFYPPASPLGRLVRRWAYDVRQAESLYFVAVALVLTVGALLSQWSWIAFGTGNTPSVAYSAVQITGGLLLGAACLLGWKSPVVVTARTQALDIQRGAEALSLHYGQVHAAERVSADLYHQHWRRYAETRVFVNRLPGELLLLRTESGPLVLGLSASDLDRLEAYLAERLDLRTVDRFVRAA